MNDESRGPELEVSSDDGTSLASALNIRLEAFLRTKSSQTQRTYRGIIREWCDFLGGERSNNHKLAERFVRARDLDAARYRLWLEDRPGQAPREGQRRDGPETSEIILFDVASRSTSRRDGLHSTLSNATIAKKLSALRRVYRYLASQDIGVGQNPFDVDRVSPPKVRSGQKRPTEMIAMKMVRALLLAPDESTAKGRRDRALLAVLFGAGLRRSEASCLRLGDVRCSEQGTVYLYLRATKGGTDARQALPEWAAEELQRWVRERREKDLPSQAYVFPTFTGKGGAVLRERPISDSGIYKLFVRYAKAAGVSEHVSPHSARATAITRLLDQGLSHRDVREFSRHSSVQMVEVYDKRRRSIDEGAGKNLHYDDDKRGS